jgi:TusA-related sulfurtransferase
MSEVINARGLGCAQPVVLAKNALELYDEITIITDEEMVLENLKLLRMQKGCPEVHIKCLVDVAGESGNIHWIRISKTISDRKITSVFGTDGIY